MSTKKSKQPLQPKNSPQRIKELNKQRPGIKRLKRRWKTTILPDVHPGQNTNKVRQTVVRMMTHTKYSICSEGNYLAEKCKTNRTWTNGPTIHYMKELKRYVLKQTRMFQSTQSILMLIMQVMMLLTVMMGSLRLRWSCEWWTWRRQWR